MKKFTLMLMLLISFSVCVQAQDANIEVMAVSPWELVIAEIDTSKYDTPSTGLTTIGVGDIVYLKAMSSEDITSVLWELVKPNGSTAMLESTTEMMTTLKTDMVGQFEVKLTVNGNINASVMLTSGMYLGKNNCIMCHSGTGDEYMTTGHADMFIRGITGVASDHYNEGCIDCHTVGYNTDPAAVNDGFDDIATETGWTYPDSLHAGVWEDIEDNYPQLALRSNIQCENCHGPGSQHMGDKSKISISLEEGVCGRCHEDGHYHRRNSQWKASGHGTGASFARGTSGSCAPCHSGEGFIALVDPQSNLDEVTGTTPVTCQVCHDPHADPFRMGEETAHQVRKLDDVTLGNGVVLTSGGMGMLCYNCHKSRRDVNTYVLEYHSHYGPHHSNQTDMLYGTGGVHFGMYIPSSTHRDAIEGTCVGCHMTPTIEDHDSPAFDKVGDHSWAMSYTDPATDMKYDHVEACVRCHGEMEHFEGMMARADHDMDGNVETTVEELHGLLHDLALLLPPVGEETVEVTNEYTPIELKAAYNYFFVEDDGSQGFHNYQYAIGILKVAISAMHYGELSAGYIENIVDVPNDQGKMVHITWSRFGGDGVSDDPVTDYIVLRSEMDPNPDGQPTYASLEAVPSDLGQLKSGATVAADDMVWTFVKEVPAMKDMMYSTDAPTVFDSTEMDGVRLTWFKIVAKTRNGLTAETMPMAGYSIDNLNPHAPAQLAADLGFNEVTLEWVETEDPDVQFYAVFRSMNAGFDIEGMEPIATVPANMFVDTEVEGGNDYFYKVVAVDFSGNVSAPSNEAAALLTDVSDFTGVPEEFTLQQNYPNPFNPSTQITYGVPEASNVRVTVYDASGTEIAVIADTYANAGYYTVTWDAGDYASGIYFCRMQAGDFNQVVKMLLMK